MIFSSIRLPAMRASALRCSMPAWPTPRPAVTRGWIGSRRKTIVQRSAFTNGMAPGAVPGSRTASSRKLGSNIDLIWVGGSGGLSLPSHGRLAAPLRCATRLLDARLQRCHQVIDAGAGQHLRRRRPGRGGPPFDKRPEPLAILVRIALRFERAGQRVDQERGHLSLFLAEIMGGAGFQFGGGQDLIQVK